VVDRQLVIKDLLEILADITQAQVQTLQRLKLRCYACRKGSNSNVPDVSKQVFNADFLSLLGLDH
jgi:hypothetical protein